MITSIIKAITIIDIIIIVFLIVISLVAGIIACIIQTRLDFRSKLVALTSNSSLLLTFAKDDSFHSKNLHLPNTQLKFMIFYRNYQIL